MVPSWALLFCDKAYCVLYILVVLLHSRNLILLSMPNAEIVAAFEAAVQAAEAAGSSPAAAARL